MSKLSKRDLRKYINSLTVEAFADNYAYVFQADLDRIYFFAADKKENRKFYTDKLMEEIFKSDERMRTVILTDLGYLKKSSIKKSIKMATKKPTAKQLAARKKFAAMAKSGELAKKRAAASKKTTATKRKTALNGKAAPGITKFAAKNVHVEGVKRDGTLKKGYKYVAGGKIVKVKKTVKKK